MVAEHIIYDLADRVYWRVIDQLNIEHKCIEVDPENPEGTRNTEMGIDLYYAIESAIEQELGFSNRLRKR